MDNYIVDLNRYNLASPPEWFLNQLYLFDSSLVILPSRQMWGYRLAQHRKPSLKDNIAYEALKEEADTAMFLSYHLVPVTTITATANWSNPRIFKELSDRAPWRNGGAEKVNAMLDSQDKAEALQKQALIDENLTSTAKDGWKYYQKLTGLRSNLYSPTVKQKVQKKSPGIVIAGAPIPNPDVKVIWGR